MHVPLVVQNKARAHEAEWWLRQLPELVAELAARWGLTLGDEFDEGSEAYVVAATLRDGTEAVLKLGVPREGAHIEHEALVLPGRWRGLRPAPQRGGGA